jgi:hypothetical protein
VILQDLLPKRSAEDVLAGLVRVELDGQAFVLPVLPIAEGRIWRDRFERTIASLLGGFALVAKPETVVAYLGTQTAALWDLLSAYDRDRILPDRDWIETHVSEAALLRAVLEVTGAAYPLAVSLLELATTQPEALREVLKRALAAPEPTSSPLPSTAGPRGRSKAA